MCKECKTNINYIAMLAFGGAILLMDVRTRNLVFNAKLAKKGMEFLIVTPTPQSVCMQRIF